MNVHNAAYSVFGNASRGSELTGMQAYFSLKDKRGIDAVADGLGVGNRFPKRRSDKVNCV